MRTIRQIYYFGLAVTLIFCTGCAQQVPLSGGPKDEIPPQVDETQSAPNYVTNFVKQEIELNFTEFVDLKDASKQIVISPPLQYPPIIKNRLKRIRIGFDEREELKENATYIINFGKSIRDFTESNELPNYAYVFSTGDYIDSLSMSGDVKDVLTGEPIEDVVVMLYVEHQDSVVFQQRPFYFARTNKEGKFNIKNLRSDTFKVVAIKDEDLNYLYNPQNEEIGFLDSLIYLNQDSITGLSIELWKEQTETLYKSYEIEAKGKLSLQFDGDVLPDAITVIDSTETYIEQLNKNKGPLIVWYKSTGLSKLSWITNTKGGLDTISARINQRNTDTLPGDFQLANWGYDRGTGLHPLNSLDFKSTSPIAAIDTSLISLLDTTTQTYLDFNLDSTSLPNSNISINATWPQESQVLMTILPGGMTDFFGKSHDTITKYIEVGAAANFGTIEVTLTNFDSTDYVIQLMKDKTILEERIKSKGIDKLVFSKIIPGTYNINIIADDNGNGKWDPGNYLQHKQSERFYNTKLEPLIEDWVLKFNLDLQKVIQDQSNQGTNSSRKEKIE